MFLYFFYADSFSIIFIKLNYLQLFVFLYYITWVLLVI